METVYVPNVGEVPLQGATGSKDSQGIYSAPLNTSGGGGGGGAVTIADGADVTAGAKADAAVTNPALSASEIALLKGVVTLLLAALPAGTNNIGSVELLDSGGVNKLAIDSSGRLTLVPNQVIEIADSAGTNKLAIDASGRLTLVPTQTVEILDSAGTNKLVIDASGRLSILGITNALPAGSNVIGHVIMDTNSTTAVTQATASSLNGTMTVQAVTGTSLATGSNALPVLLSASTGYVAAWGSNPAALTTSTDYSFKWGGSGTTVVNHGMIFNGTATGVNFDLDVAATAGSPLLAAGQFFFFDVQTTAVHLFQAGTPNVNGSSASNIVVRGWL